MRILKGLKSLFEPFYIDVQLDITNACNLRCKHCYHPHHKNDGALTLDQWFEAIRLIKIYCARRKITPRFIVCGGEPTLSSYFAPILEFIFEQFEFSMDHSPRIRVLTNGTHITEKTLSLAKKFGLRFQVSLDGPDAKSHNAIRGPLAFEQACFGISTLVESLSTKNHNPVELLAVLHSESSANIPHFFDAAKVLGVDAMNFVRLIEQGHGVEFGKSAKSLKGQDLKFAMESILAHSKRTGVRTSTDSALWALISPDLGSAKRLGFYEIIIDYKGYLKVSSRTQYRIGHILSDSLEKMMDHPILKKLRVGQIQGCMDCQIFKQGRCSGDRNSAFAQSGDFLGPDPGCWLLEEKTNYEFKNLKKQKGIPHYLFNSRTHNRDNFILEKKNE